MPCFSISSKVITWTGSAPSLAKRLMLLPVISTRWIVCCVVVAVGYLRHGGTDDADQGNQVSEFL